MTREQKVVDALKRMRSGIRHVAIGKAYTGRYDETNGGLLKDPTAGLSTGYVWVRREGSRHAVRALNTNGRAPLNKVNVSVIVGERTSDGEMEVLDADWSTGIDQFGGAVYDAYQTRHTHSTRDIDDGRVYLAESETLRFRVRPHFYRNTSGDRDWWPDALGSDVTVTPTASSGEHQLAIIALDTDAAAPALTVTLSTPVSLSVSLTREDATNVVLAADNEARGAIHLFGGETAVRGEDYVWDMRPWFEGGSSGTGGSGDLRSDGTVSMASDFDLADNAILAEELGATPSMPATGKWKLYFRPTGLFIVDDAGVTTGPFIDNVAGGIGTGSAAYASRPAAGNTGNLFFPSDGFSVDRDDGAAWESWGPVYPFTSPNNADFAWVNQGGASVTVSKGGIYLLAPNSGTSTQLRGRVKTAPSTPYVITAYLTPSNNLSVDDQSYGLMWRQLDGKLVRFGIGAGNIYLQYWSSATAFAGSYVTYAWRDQQHWFRITDDGTNRKAYVSSDGVNWLLIHSVSRTDNLTADQVGFWATAKNGTLDMGVTLMSWKES